jgi:hypothetical protein
MPDMNLIAVNLLVGGVLIPALLFLLALFFLWYRDRRDWGPLSPRSVSLVIILCILASWMVTGFNILSLLLGQ